MNNPDAPKLKLFGISGKLNEFCTTEKDLQRSINRMPNDFYLMDESQKKAGDAGDPANGDDLNIDDLADDFFEFVVLDKEAIE